MAKSFKDLSEAEKKKRYEYNKQYRERLRAAAIAGGYAPAQRTKLTPEERVERRKMHNKNYRERMRAAYKRELQREGLTPSEASREVRGLTDEEIAQLIPTPDTSMMIWEAQQRLRGA